MSTIQTYTGAQFDFAEPTPDMVRIEDIAIGVSREGRYCNQSRWKYSVAQHSYLASCYCNRWEREALLHDATEAYMRDIPSPLKKLIPQYAVIEARVKRAIWGKFELSWSEQGEAAVKKVDGKLLATEFRDLVIPAPDWSQQTSEKPLDETIVPWSEEFAYQMFMGRFYSLFSVKRRARVPA